MPRKKKGTGPPQPRAWAPPGLTRNGKPAPGAVSSSINSSFDAPHHKKKMSLLDGDGGDTSFSSTPPPQRLGFSKTYAAQYKERKAREDLTNLRAKYGNVPEEEESTSESEDSEAEADTPGLEHDFFRTLAALKADDKRIYDKESVFFRQPEEEAEATAAGADTSLSTSAAATAKPMYLRDHERRRILTKGDQAFVSDGEESETESAAGAATKESYSERQARLKSAFLSSAEGLGTEGGSGKADDAFEGNGLLRAREKSEAEQAAEEADYGEWLRTGEGAALAVGGDDAEKLEPLRRFWTDPKLSKQDRFLRDYLTKHLWRPENAHRVPTYEEIVGDGDGNRGGKSALAAAAAAVAAEVAEPLIDEEEDAKAVEEAEAYEHKYNFRFEEGDSSEVKMYPRVVEESVRRKDDRRKKARADAKARREEEKTRKKEEVKRLKALKRKEIERKLEQVATVAAVDKERLAKLGYDLEGEFDPQKHDAMIGQLFDEDYYDAMDGNEKPVWNDEEDMLGIASGAYGDYGEWEGEGGMGEGEETSLHVDDEGFNMDADFVPGAQQRVSKKDKKNKKKRRKRGKDEAEEDKAREEADGAGTGAVGSAADAGGDRSLSEHIDELYNLDYEDVVGEIKTRFPYRQVVPNNFGLTTDEILAADVRELNQWVSVKRLSQYRSEADEMYDVKKFQKRSKNHAKKRDILASVYDQEKGAVAREAALAESLPARKRKKDAKSKKKKKEKRSKESHEGEGAAGDGEKRAKRSKKSKSENSGGATKLSSDGSISKSRLALYASLKG